jgi:hypothetical protein
MQRYSSTLSLTSALDGVGSQRHAPAALPPGKGPSTHCTGGWVGPRAGLVGYEKSRPHRNDNDNKTTVRKYAKGKIYVTVSRMYPTGGPAKHNSQAPSREILLYDYSGETDFLQH